MNIIDSKNIFETLEFDNYAYLEGLEYAEKFLIEKYLDKKAKTLEAATAGARILLEMKKMGFAPPFYGFDCSPKMIEVAKQRDTENSIFLDVQDASNLNYKDSSFDQVMYLQQIMCLIQNASARYHAFQEAYRVLKSGGIALFSFVCFDVRIKNIFYLPYLGYLYFLRKLIRANRSIQYIPWLKHSNKPNFSALIDREPYVYWYKIQEVYKILKQANFKIVAMGTSHQIYKQKMHVCPETLANEPLDILLYVVCQK